MLLTFFSCLVLMVIVPRQSHQTSLDLNIELLGAMTKETMASLQYAANKTSNSSLKIHIRKISVELGKSNLFEYADSIKNKIVVFMENQRVDHKSCIMSTITGRPLFTLEGRPLDLHEVELCRKVVSVSANTDSYERATRDFVRNNPKWQKIIILYELEESTHVAHMQLGLASEMSRISLLLMEKNHQETDEQLLQRTWKTIVKMKPKAVIPLVNDGFLKKLLQMKTCSSLQEPLTWLIQGKFPINLTNEKTFGQNIVVAFQLPVANTSDTEQLKKAVMRDTPGKLVQEDTLLAHDALVLIAKATGDVTKDSRWNQSAINSSMPTNSQLHMEYILKTSINGVTGVTHINSNLERDVTKLQIWNLMNNKPVQIGDWTPSGGIVLIQPMSINFESDLCKQPSLQGHTLRITTVEVHPYIIKYTKPDGTTGYKGFCIDLLDHLSRDLGFNYVIEYSPDKKYGALINEEWDGMIRQLVDKKTDMAVAALTVTESREKAVDFTVAYQHYTDDLIFAKEKDEDNLFIFVDPLSSSIWFCLAGTVCFVGIVTYLLNYYCPYGWKDASGKGTAKEFSFFNSLWFSLACILQQGAEDRPKALSGRIFAGVYWFCILVFVSTYTANLAAFFTAKSAATTIKNIQDVINSDYSIGVTSSSALYSFFRETDYESYQQIWYRMQSRKTFPNGTMLGIEWARTRKYVHIADGPILKYAITRQPCNLMTAPGLSSPKGLAFALQPGSIYTKNITLSLLRMREKGILDERQDFWWVRNSECPKQDTNSLDSKKVHLKNMVGVYIVLGGGTVLAFIVLIIEIIWKRKAEEKVKKLRQRTVNNVLRTTVKPFTSSQT